MKIRYREWAIQLLKEIHTAPASHQVSILEDHLLKASHRGRVAEILSKERSEIEESRKRDEQVNKPLMR